MVAEATTDVVPRRRTDFPQEERLVRYEGSRPRFRSPLMRDFLEAHMYIVDRNGLVTFIRTKKEASETAKELRESQK